MRVIWTSWAHVWRFHSLFLRTGYDTSSSWCPWECDGHGRPHETHPRALDSSRGEWRLGPNLPRGAVAQPRRSCLRWASGVVAPWARGCGAHQKRPVAVAHLAVTAVAARVHSSEMWTRTCTEDRSGGSAMVLATRGGRKQGRKGSSPATYIEEEWGGRWSSLYAMEEKMEPNGGTWLL
jgi:hypothetical protein